MRIRELLKCAFLLAACLALPLEAQRLVVLPGAAATGATASAFLADPLASAGTINAAPGAFAVFAKPNGSLFYVVTTTGVVVVDSAGAQVQAPLSVPQPVTAAALSPDGQRLVVAAGDASAGYAHLYDTSGSTALFITAIPVAASPLDVAFAIDSKTAYVLSAGSLTPINVTANTAGTAVNVTASTSGSAKPGVSVGPNGIVYVNASGVLLEMDPTTLQTLNTIAIGGFPGKPEFSPDGKIAITAKQVDSGPALAVIDLTTRTITDTLPAFQFAINRLFYYSADVVYAYSPNAASSLFQFSPAAPRTWTQAKFDGAVVSGIKCVAASSETSPPAFLYAVSPTTVTRLDLKALTRSSVPLSTGAGAAYYLPQAQIGSPVAATKFNATQTLVTGAWSLPLLIRVTDSDGRPVYAQPVKWSTPSGVTLRNAMTLTNPQGYASAFAMPSKAGTYSVTAQLTNTPIAYSTFSLTAGAPPADGGDNGGGPVGGGISMVSGNGQLIPNGLLTQEPLVVLVTDSAGKPAPGVPVTFTRTGTGGNLSVNFRDAGQSECIPITNGYTCNTDGRGLASMFFQGFALTSDWIEFTATPITASITGNGTTSVRNVVFTVTAIPDIKAFPIVVSVTPPPGTAQFSGQGGQTLKAAIQVRVATLRGTPIPNVGMTLRQTPGYTFGKAAPAQCAGPGGVALTDTKGIATCDLVFGSTAGTFSLWRVVAGSETSAQYTVKITAAPPPAQVPTTIAITNGDNQSAPINRTLPTQLGAVVNDQSGAPIPNQTVVWSVVQGNATLQNQSTKTSTTGRATTSVLLGPTPGPLQIKLQAGTVSVIFHATATVEISSFTKVSGDSQSAAIGEAFANPVVVQVATAAGPLAGFPVEFAATNGSISGTSVNTDASGQAKVNVTAGPTAGPVQVTATAGGQTVTFNLTALPPGPQLTPDRIVNGASFTPGFSFGSIVTIIAPGLTGPLNIPAGTCLTDDAGVGLPTDGGALPTRLGGVEIQFGNQLAPIFAICKNADGTEQANVQAPFELAPTDTGITVTLRYGAGTEEESTFSVSGVPVKNAAPGIFEYTAGDAKVAVATKADGTVISPSNPAHPGDTIQVYTTGFGPILPNVQTNTPAVAGQVPYFKPTVTLGETQMGGVTAKYADIGLVVVTFQIPSGQATGDAVALKIGVVNDAQNPPVESQVSHIAIK